MTWAVLSTIVAGNALAGCRIATPSKKTPEELVPAATQVEHEMEEGRFADAGEKFVSFAQACPGTVDAQQVGEVCASLELIKKYADAMIANKGLESWKAGLSELDHENMAFLTEGLKHYAKLMNGSDYDLRKRMLYGLLPTLNKVRDGLELTVQAKNSSVSKPRGILARATGLSPDWVLKDAEKTRNAYLKALSQALQP